MSRRGLPFGFGIEAESILNDSQSKPHLALPINHELNEDEENVAKQSISFAKLVADGPFFTGSTIGPREETGDGIQRHSDKYKKTKKIGRTIEEHPYQLEFFPDELYSVMGISNKQKKMLLSAYKVDGGLQSFNLTENDDEKATSLLEKFKNLAEEIEVNEDKDQPEEIEEEFDDEYEEDDDDDYNAEKYFDDGDDEGMDGGDDEAAF